MEEDGVLIPTIEVIQADKEFWSSYLVVFWILTLSITVDPLPFVDGPLFVGVAVRPRS